MNTSTFSKGDLVEIPQGIHLSKDISPHLQSKILKTDKPVVCLFLDYGGYDGNYAKVLIAEEGEWFCPIKSVKWCENKNVN